MIMDVIEKYIFRLRIPFEGFTTSVYIYICEQGVALIDCATCASDVDDYILPALDRLNISVDDVKFILVSHSHRDHIGGLKRMSQIFHCSKIYSAGNI